MERMSLNTPVCESSGGIGALPSQGINKYGRDTGRDSRPYGLGVSAIAQRVTTNAQKTGNIIETALREGKHEDRNPSVI
jgi:hypothetical protein